MLKKMLGIAPRLEEDGSFSPSALGIMLATSKKTAYDGGAYADPYTEGRWKVLVVCTEERHLTMKNGKRFSTGNHPVETLLPLMHLAQAGFGFDVCTPSGAPACLEMWAMPSKDAAVLAFFDAHRARFEAPLSLATIVSEQLPDNDYLAVFLPGGHGALLGLPESEDLARLLDWLHDEDRYLLTICHGPAALLCAGGGDRPFPYAGYRMAVFPDSMDRKTPLFGYMPGPMPYFVCERLRALGVEIVNRSADKTCHRDRKLLSGASPQAAQPFGRLAAETLLEAARERG